MADRFFFGFYGISSAALMIVSIFASSEDFSVVSVDTSVVDFGRKTSFMKGFEVSSARTTTQMSKLMPSKM